MDATLRHLFSRRKSQKPDQLQLRAHRYESTVKQTSPVKGTRPIAGNGPYRLEYVGLQSQDLIAEPPNVPRSRGESYSSRPQTASLSAQFDPYGRTRSGFSNKTPSAFSRNAHEPPLNKSYHAQPLTQRVRSVSAFSSESPQAHKKSAHVDILDAASQINPLAQAYIPKRVALGKRDYGEDVADRNIAEFGGDEFPQHDEDSNYTDDMPVSRDQLSSGEDLQGRPDAMGKLDSRDGSTRAPVSRLASDGAGDDTTSENQQSQHSFGRISSHAIPSPSKHSPPTAANSHARRESGHSYHSNANGARGSVRSGRSSSASTDAPPSLAKVPQRNVTTSASLYYMSGALSHVVPTDESLRETANSSQPIRKYRVSRGTQTTPPIPEHIIVPSVISAITCSDQDSEYSDSELSDPPPILKSNLSRRVILPTPPMSPVIGGSPTTSIPRASLDKELPPPPPQGTQASQASDRHSRDGPASHHMDPSQDGQRGGHISAPALTITGSEIGGSNLRPNDGNRSDLILEGSSEPPRLEDVVDLSNTTDTEIITKQLPPVVHEHITPKVHHIIEKRISREVHDHHVFHRIQPVTDVEVLPPKHYVLAQDGRSLIEIPESELPGRHTKWAVQPVDDNVATTTSFPSRADVKTTAKHPGHLAGSEPLLQHTKNTVTDDGIAREETVWRHKPQLETGGQATGQTVPLTINHIDDEDTDENYDTASERYAASDPYAGSVQTVSTRADGEEELLFRDSELAFDGRLPGLEEANPVVEGNLPSSRPSTAATRKADQIGTKEAPVTPGRQREPELESQMGQLRVTNR